MKAKEIRRYFIENGFEISEYTDTTGRVRIVAEPLNPKTATLRTQLLTSRKAAFNSLLHQALQSLK